MAVVGERGRRGDAAPIEAAQRGRPGRHGCPGCSRDAPGNRHERSERKRRATGLEPLAPKVPRTDERPHSPAPDRFRRGIGGSLVRTLQRRDGPERQRCSAGDHDAGARSGGAVDTAACVLETQAPLGAIRLGNTMVLSPRASLRMPRLGRERASKQDSGRKRGRLEGTPERSNWREPVRTDAPPVPTDAATIPPMRIDKLSFDALMEMYQRLFRNSAIVSRELQAILSESRWPANCEEFWSWPPVVRCFQELGTAEMEILRLPGFHVVADMPLEVPSKVQPYRLRWLQEDARALLTEGDDRTGAMDAANSRLYHSGGSATDGELKHNHRRGTPCPACAARTLARRTANKTSDKADAAVPSEPVRALTIPERIFQFTAERHASAPVDGDAETEDGPWAAANSISEDMLWRRLPCLVAVAARAGALQIDDSDDLLALLGWVFYRGGGGAATARRCEVCWSAESTPADRFVVCATCGTSVHLSCYGGKRLRDHAANNANGGHDAWRCRACQQETRTQRPTKEAAAAAAAVNTTPPCRLCGQSGGAVKPTDTGEWAHLACALWTPSAYVADATLMEPVCGVGAAAAHRHGTACSVCGHATALPGTVSCGWRDCREAAHVTCGRRAGFAYLLADARAFHEWVDRTQLAAMLGGERSRGPHGVVRCCLCVRHAAAVALTVASHIREVDVATATRRVLRPSAAERADLIVKALSVTAPQPAMRSPTNGEMVLSRLSKTYSAADVSKIEKSGQLKPLVEAIRQHIMRHWEAARQAAGRRGRGRPPRQRQRGSGRIAPSNDRLLLSSWERCLKQLARLEVLEKEGAMRGSRRLASPSERRRQVASILSDVARQLPSLDSPAHRDTGERAVLTADRSSAPGRPSSDRAADGHIELPLDASACVPLRTAAAAPHDIDWLVHAMHDRQWQSLRSAETASVPCSCRRRAVAFESVIDASGLVFEGTYSVPECQLAPPHIGLSKRHGAEGGELARCCRAQQCQPRLVQFQLRERVDQHCSDEEGASDVAAPSSAPLASTTAPWVWHARSPLAVSADASVACEDDGSMTVVTTPTPTDASLLSALHGEMRALQRLARTTSRRRRELLSAAQADLQHRRALEQSQRQFDAHRARLAQLQAVRWPPGRELPSLHSNWAEDDGSVAPSSTLRAAAPHRHGGLARLESCVPMSMAEVQAEAAMRQTGWWKPPSKVRSPPAATATAAAATDNNALPLEDARLQPAYDACCHVCGGGDCDQPDNDIILCDQCGVAVHQQCYGVAAVPAGDWYCDACRVARTTAVPPYRLP